MRELVWHFLSAFYVFYLRFFYHMKIEKNVKISYKANLDKSINPKGIHIGEYSWILANSTILAHDYCRNLKADTYIGKRCVIGMNAFIMPGVKIGNNVIVGSCSVVTKDIPDNCIVVGNPGKIIKEGILLDEKGQIIKENI